MRSCDVSSLRECSQSADVTEVEAEDTQEVMTCSKYGWSASDSTQLLYANKDAAEPQPPPQQLQQHLQDAVPSSDATIDDDELLGHTRYIILLYKEGEKKVYLPKCSL